MAIFKKGDIMEKVIKNMNFKPILENISPFMKGCFKLSKISLIFV